MERRTVLKRIGGTGLAIAGAAGLTGSASANSVGRNELSITFWREEGAPHRSGWYEDIGEFMLDIKSYLERRGLDTVNVASFYWKDDARLSIDGDLGYDSIKDAVEEYHAPYAGDRTINVLMTARDDVADLGFCYGTHLRDGGNVIHLNQYHPAISFLDPLPGNWRKPMLAHEVAHAFGAGDGHEEHQLGAQRFDWTEGWSATAMAAPYSVLGQSQDTDDWEDCNDNDWSKYVPLTVEPLYEYSKCTDGFIRDYLGGDTSAGTATELGD